MLSILLCGLASYSCRRRAMSFSCGVMGPLSSASSPAHPLQQPGNFDGQEDLGLASELLPGGLDARQFLVRALQLLNGLVVDPQVERLGPSHILRETQQDRNQVNPGAAEDLHGRGVAFRGIAHPGEASGNIEKDVVGGAEFAGGVARGNAQPSQAGTCLLAIGTGVR